MPKVTTLTERYEKYSAKTTPERVGARYEASKTIAIKRMREGSSKIVSIRELVRSILDTAGVPAGQWAIYLSFAQRMASMTNSYTGPTLIRRVEGMKAGWLAKGADPAILEKIVKLFTG